MMNPEFRRNLWLSFSVQRLLAMPVLLGLIFLAIGLSDHYPVGAADALYFAATILFMFVVWLWGARNANSAIVDELRDKTWDQQRMSALAPWTMTWGKLFGSTAFNWYGGAICLAIAIPSAIVGEQPFWLSDLPTLTAVALMLHAALIALNLHSAQLEMQLIQRGGLGWLAIIFAFPAFSFFLNTSRQPHPISWWDMDLENSLFLLGSALLFAACAIFAAWRVMCNALQVRTMPWAWPLFAVILSIYFAGIGELATDLPLFALGYVGLFIATVMTYATLLTEPASLLIWNRLRVRQQSGDWRGWLEHLPIWPTTMLLAFCFALLATAAQPQFIYRLPHLPILHEPLAAAFMLLRDASIVLFFSFARTAKRATTVAVLYLAVIDALLPILFKAGGLDALSYLLLPVGGAHGAGTSVLVMACHAAIALALVAWRLRKQAAPA